MATHIVNTHEAKTHLSKLLDKVSRGGEVYIGKHGLPVAKLVAYHPAPQRRSGGQLKGKIRISKAFDKLPKKFIAHFTSIK
jgi:prevent-host-death family protein